MPKIRRRKRTRRRLRGGATWEGLIFSNNSLTIQFGDQTLNGSRVSRDFTKNVPDIQIKPISGAAFCTLICFDLDAVAKSWIHLLYANSEACNLLTRNEVFEWTPPTPPSGEHRYVFALFTHEYPITEFPKERGYFNIANFASQNGLNPHSAVSMTSI
jgi:phosphatidylethanolamine-binding protein (PEBP) family uncharacterized protein